MKALISPNEQRFDGYRVAEISSDGFPVADPLYWVDCPNNIVADQFWYDPSSGLYYAIPASIESIDIDNKTNLLVTVITGSNHNLTTGQSILLSGQNPLQYSGSFKINVVNPTTFTYKLTVIPTQQETESYAALVTGHYILEHAKNNPQNSEV